MRSGNRSPGQSPADPAPFSRWIAIAFILVVGLILWVGVLSDASGHPTMPVSSILYVAAVVGVAGSLAYADRHGASSGKSRKDRTGSK